MNLENKYLSFVIPIYINDSRYVNFLKECIESLKKQTDSKWYAFFIDDCSPISDVKKILINESELDSRIKPIFLQKRISTGECRNIGIQEAKKYDSPIIMFNDADDLSHKRRVEVVRKKMASDECDVLYANFIPIDENSIDLPKVPSAIEEILEALKTPPEGKNCWIDFSTKTGYVNITSSTNVKTSLALLEPFPDSYISEDMHTWFRYSARGNLEYSSLFPTRYRIPSFVRRQSSERYTLDFNKEKYLMDKDGFEKALNIYLGFNKIEKENLKFIRIQFLLRLAMSFAMNDRLDLVKKIAKEILEFEEK